MKNFRGYLNEKKFVFDGAPFVMLTAPNGNGKTSLIDAIEWCLTGDIKHLRETFEHRNTTKTEKKENQDAILKNTNNQMDSVRVCVTIITNNNEEFVIERTQSEDTLDNGGNVVVNNYTEEESEKILNKIVDEKNFYKFHFCSMQKTYNFLNKNKEEMKNEFSDFSTDYSEEERVVENLKIFIEDIKKKKENLKKDLVADSTINELKEQIKKYQDSPEIIPYDVIKIFENEQTNVQEFYEKELIEQQEKLYKCGYSRVKELLKKKEYNRKIVVEKNLLQNLKNELAEHKMEIKWAIQNEIYKEENRIQLERELKKYSELKITKENLEGIKEELFKIKGEHFNEEYWNKNSLIRKKLQNEYESLTAEIKTLTRGNEILEFFADIVAKKEKIILYRKEQKKKEPDKKILCPLCSSELFDDIDDSKLTVQAASYQKEHLELIEKKQRLLNEIKEKLKNNMEEQLNFAEIDLQKHIEKLNEKFNNVTKIYNCIKKYFESYKELNNQNPEAYTLEKVSDENNINKYIEERKSKLLTDKEYQRLDEEIRKILFLLNHSVDENDSDESLLASVEMRVKNAPKGIAYDYQRLENKINSIKSYIGNKQYMVTNQKLKKNEENNKVIINKIEELSLLEKKVNLKVRKIKQEIEELRKKEYAEVGPFLYSIYNKLSRNSGVSGIKLTNRKSGRIMLADDEENALLNILSDGQLSVFMVSYFLGNIFRLGEKEKIKVYFIDDITGCMDDINMLAFLDLIKYQLLDKEGRIGQIVFATCDERMEKLLTYKMESAGILYKKIGNDMFQ